GRTRPTARFPTAGGGGTGSAGRSCAPMYIPGNQIPRKHVLRITVVTTKGRNDHERGPARRHRPGDAAAAASGGPADRRGQGRIRRVPGRDRGPAHTADRGR